MKKLMLAAAIVCAAVTAQAINMWVDIQHLSAPSSFEVTSKCCDMYAYKTDATQSQLVKNNLVWSPYHTPPTSIDDQFNWEGGTGSLEDYNYYWVLTYTLSDGSSKTLSTLGSGLDYEVLGYIDYIYNPDSSWSDWDSYTENASNWKAAPEPTSAMLMLLGVAGLALKRKQK